MREAGWGLKTSILSCCCTCTDIPWDAQSYRIPLLRPSDALQPSPSMHLGATPEKLHGMSLHPG